MRQFNLSTFAKTALLVWLLAFTHLWLTWAPLDTSEPASEEGNLPPLPELQQNDTKREDNTKVVQLFSAFAPIKETPSPIQDSKPVEKPPVVIDKSLLPNFSPYDDDHQVGLSAIINADKQFAVVEIINYATKQSRFEEISEGDSLGKYRLALINKESITLEAENIKLVLELFSERSK